MPFDPSIGAVISLIQVLNDIHQKCHDAPAEINAAVKDAKLIKVELESMREKVCDEKYFVTKNGGAMLVSWDHYSINRADRDHACDNYRYV